MNKKRGMKINLSNRWKYSLIFLGILLIVAVGVYAYGTLSPNNMGHTAREMDFTGGFTVPSGDINITTGKLCFGSVCKSNFTG